jgi:lysozyme
VTPHLEDDIARDEGFRLRAYPDPLSPRAIELRKPEPQRLVGWEKLSGDPWTCGFGCTGPDVKEGTFWTLEEARKRLSVKIAEAIADLDRNLPWWRQLNDARQDVLVNMAFNMGWPTLSTFHNTLAAVKAGDYERADVGMLASRWAQQTKGRAKRLAAQMRTGERA